jgi:hypothetical protein
MRYENSRNARLDGSRIHYLPGDKIKYKRDRQREREREKERERERERILAEAIRVDLKYVPPNLIEL